MATDTGSWPGGYRSCEMGNSKNVFVKVTSLERGQRVTVRQVNMQAVIA
jgi:hypothetical protein